MYLWTDLVLGEQENEAGEEKEGKEEEQKKNNNSWQCYRIITQK